MILDIFREDNWTGKLPSGLTINFILNDLMFYLLTLARFFSK